MIMRHSHKIAFFLFILILYSCDKTLEVSSFTKPLVTINVNKGTQTVGDMKIAIGPLKDYEQDSDVNFAITVSSTSRQLTSFKLVSSSDALSAQSKIIRTDPLGAIDEKGNFAANISSATIYYTYHIDPLVQPLSMVTLQFNFQNDAKYVGTTSHVFRVIKKGSSSGNPLNIITLSPFASYYSVVTMGIGIQDNMNPWSGIRGEGGTSVAQRLGGFYSLEKRMGYRDVNDVIISAFYIDLVGYKTKTTGTKPVLVNNSYYLVSPSDTVILTTTYTGASTTPDVKDLQLRNTIRQMVTTLKADKKGLRKILFKRLDNISGTNQVTPDYFDQLTHDNEFAALLGSVATDGTTFVGPVALNQVYGFVMDDGRKGLFRTSATTGIDWNGLITQVPTPNSGSWVLYGTIKYQNSN
jgi:hypothetical protein